MGANGSAPGDPNLSVGPNHIVQIVNTQYAAYDKNGNIFPGYPKTLGSIFTALGGTCTREWGDPIAQYDKAADRWLLDSDKRRYQVKSGQIPMSGYPTQTSGLN